MCCAVVLFSPISVYDDQNNKKRKEKYNVYSAMLLTEQPTGRERERERERELSLINISEPTRPP